MKKMYCVVLCSLFVLVTNTMQSQLQEPVAHPWWVTLGGGAGIVGGSLIMNAGMAYSYQFENSYLTGRLAGATNKNPTILEHSPSSLIYKIADYGILYGPIWHYQNYSIAFGSGVGLVRIAYENSNDITLSQTSSISLPLEAQLFWRPTNFFGVGVYGYVTLNFEKTFSGLWISAQLGKW